MASNHESESELPPSSQKEYLVWQQLMNQNKQISKDAIEKKVFAAATDVKSETTTEDEESDMSISDSEEETQPAQQEPSSFKLREYQKELAEKALEGKNTIICAPTGSGKTWVAIHIIEEHMKKMDNEGLPKKVAFMARTVPLVMQQYALLRKFLPNYKAAQITGQSSNSRSLDLLFPEYDIIAMTPMILVNHLQTKKLEDIGQFSLIILDECHHTRKDEPYNTLMFQYHKAKKDYNQSAVPLPQIIGLTASIGTEKAESVDQAKDSIVQVCSNLDCFHLSTVERNINELRENVPMPAEICEVLVERSQDEFKQKIEEIMDIFEETIDYHGYGIHDTSEDYTDIRGLAKLMKAIDKPRVKLSDKSKPLNKKRPEYGHWVKTVMKNAKRIPIHHIHEEPKLRFHIRSVIILSEYLVEFSLALQAYDLVEMREVLGYLEKRLKDFEISEEISVEGKRLYRYFQELQDLITQRNSHKENPNLKLIADILQHHLIERGKESRGIVFVKTRALTEALVTWLEKCGDSQLAGLNPRAFTGSRAPEIEGGMSREQQEETINLFRAGTVRLLIATSVAEEGLDIPKCNLVIQYNYVGNEVTTVQTRGRCRANGGLSVLLAMGDIPEKERVNKRRVELMGEAIEKVQGMHESDRSEFERKIREHQRKSLSQKLIDEKREKQVLQNTPFTMVCTMCRQVSVPSTHVRTIYQKHRICIDRGFLDNIEFAWQDKSEQIDELLLVGKVTCKGQVKTESVCRNKLGVMFSHRKCPFVALKVEAFGYFTNRIKKLATYKKWKQVPYAVTEITEGDIDRYLDDNKGLTVMEQISGNIQPDINLPPPMIAEPQPDSGIDWNLVRLHADIARATHLSDDSFYFALGSAPALSGELSQFKPRSSENTMSSMKMSESSVPSMNMSEEASTASSSVPSMNMDEAASDPGK